MLTLISAVAAALLVIAMAPGLAFATQKDESISDTCLQCHSTGNAPEVQKESSHPFAVDYDLAQRSRPHLRPSSARTPFGATIADDMLVNGKVECMSCHVRHEEWTGAEHRLRTSTTTALCVICHDVRNARMVAKPSAANT